MFPKKLQSKLESRRHENALRSLRGQNDLVDFSSNDYLGFAKSTRIFELSHEFLLAKNIKQNGATGSRLLSGNHELFDTVEKSIAGFHQSESALIFNSGYNANVGFFSAIPQKGDIILYDEFAHASIREGIHLSRANAYKFKHNDLNDFSEKLQDFRDKGEALYVVTESVFSMDGDAPDLKSMVNICKENNAFLIVDEAHALGVIGNNGAGLVQKLGLELDIFARIVTFGKALGCHGAAILGENPLRDYLINFSRSFIYTTAMPPHNLATLFIAYKEMSQTDAIAKLQNNIDFFKTQIIEQELQAIFISSSSSVFSCVLPGNEYVKQVSNRIQTAGYDVKAILSPTVLKGQERLRFCIHSYNTHDEIRHILQLLSTFVK